ncbi:MAG TPA: hypothetical protein VKB84_10830 [Candidatus Binataceae bacterium]|nr:hypothetical protein [Candidatus Binataceae bacterium]
MIYLLIAFAATLLTGCASRNNFEERPFFQQEYELESHGRKTWFDRLVEFDPGRFHVDVARDFNSNPPARIAVLPFTDQGSANYVVDKIPLTFRTKQQRYDWSWTDAQRLRRAIQGYLAQREFLLANLYGVDAIVQEHGIDNMTQLEGVSPRDLGAWLDVDAVMYGSVLHYEAYYFGLVAAWQVGIHIRLVSSRDGETLIDASGSRWDVNVLPALDVQDIAINSAENILQLRDINLARAEEEACREVVKRIPRSQRLINEMAVDAREREIRLEARRPSPQPPSVRTPALPQESYPVILDRPGDVPVKN